MNPYCKKKGETTSKRRADNTEEIVQKNIQNAIGRKWKNFTTQAEACGKLCKLIIKQSQGLIKEDEAWKRPDLPQRVPANVPPVVPGQYLETSYQQNVT